MGKGEMPMGSGGYDGNGGNADGIRGDRWDLKWAQTRPKETPKGRLKSRRDPMPAGHVAFGERENSHYSRGPSNPGQERQCNR
jgi:hypothetical protein